LIRTPAGDSIFTTTHEVRGHANKVAASRSGRKDIPDTIAGLRKFGNLLKTCRMRLKKLP
jgi:hypothetical protein